MARGMTFRSCFQKLVRLTTHRLQMFFWQELNQVESNPVGFFFMKCVPRRNLIVIKPAWLALACFLASQDLISASAGLPDGGKLFRQQCARCHGQKGEGVKYKFDQPLQGDRSIEKLTRYIERSMPDDDPGTCVGDDATTVARYIYDSFYSQEARWRKDPPRVQLVRLTNRQILNTVADLLGIFSGSKPVSPTAERGLRGEYYASKESDRNHLVLERVDRQIDFDFDATIPDQKMGGTNSFSVNWNGSLIVDETGEYEFFIRTANGVRLYVNGPDEPLIDQWVSSGQLTEHHGRVRLIGGRMYPLQLRLFRFKDKTNSISLQWKPPQARQQSIPERNLSPIQTSPTFVVTTPFPPDDSSVGYERGVLVSKAWDEATTQAAIEIANHVTAHLDLFTKSKPDATNRLTKVNSFCDDFVSAAFRHPLTAEQKKRHITDQFKRGKTAEDAVKRAVLLALKSPQFLYLGLDDLKPDDFVIASRLAFGLWDSLPDRDLEAAAAKGELHTREQLAAQARRMLADPRAHAKTLAFLHHWLQMDRVESLSKDGQLFPGFTAEIISDLRASLDIFLEDTFWGKKPDYRTLLQADYLFVDNRLARFYGFPTNTTDEFVRVQPDDGQRSGVLTHPYLLSAFSYSKQTSPIHRGVFLTRNIVGRALKPPPIAVAFKDAEFAPNLTMREKVSALTRPQNCQTCHSVINPLGFSLEYFDAVGRFRTSEQNRPIDATGEFVTSDGETILLTGARDIAQMAIASDSALNTFIEQMFHQVVKQPICAYGFDVKNRLRESFVASDYNLQKLLVEIVVTSAIHRSDNQRSSKIKP